MEKLLTIFTPAYNRGYTIHKTYESLKRQTNKNFKWLIIDDGSTDNTRELIEKWIKEDNKFEISYIYKKNGGMHSAHNTAYENIDTELNVCIDSDDYMPDDAVEHIINTWNTCKDDKEIAGIAGLDIYENSKEVIGTKFPEGLTKSTLFDLYNKYGVSGDKKLVYRSELTKQYPYPEYDGEKYVGLDYKYNKIGEQYKLRLVNEILCIVEYMEDGSSKNMLKQYRNNPKGWCFYRLENIKRNNTSIKYRFKEYIHYVSSSLMLKEKGFIKKAPHKVLCTLAVPFGYLLKTYIYNKTKE